MNNRTVRFQVRNIQIVVRNHPLPDNPQRVNVAQPVNPPPVQVNVRQDNRPIQVNVVSSTTKGPYEIGEFYFNLELSESDSE